MEQIRRFEQQNIKITGIPGIDRQHSDLIFMLDAFLEALKKDDLSDDDIYSSFEEITACLKSHFATEEGLIEMVGYSKITDHKAQHREYITIFLRELKSLKNKDKEKIALFIKAFRETIMLHISVTDTEYVNFIDNLVATKKKFCINASISQTIAG